MNELVSDTLRALEARGFKTHYFESASAMRDFVLESVPASASVGFGGSVTTEQLGLYDALKERKCTVHFHWREPRENRAAVFEAARKADVYIMSSNAVSADGALLNIDGNGNRVGSLVDGPKTVFIILGVNKLTINRAEAFKRVKTIACPANARRLGLDTPCARTGACADCRSPQRMCNYIVWTESPRKGATVHVCVAACQLGF